MDAKKFPHILERAARDELIEQGERLQRGELAEHEAEALRNSPDEQARVVYELYRPLTDLEKRRLLKEADQGSGAVRRAVMVFAAAAAVVLFVAFRPLAPEAAQPIVDSSAAAVAGGQHLLGASAEAAVPVVDIGGCTSLLVAARSRSARLPDHEQVLAFFQRGDTIVPWPARLKYAPASGVWTGEQYCTRVPTDGLSEGEWQLAIVYGSALPSPEQARAAVRGAWIPFWARWSVARASVHLRRVNP